MEEDIIRRAPTVHAIDEKFTQIPYNEVEYTEAQKPQHEFAKDQEPQYEFGTVREPHHVFANVREGENVCNKIKESKDDVITNCLEFLTTTFSDGRFDQKWKKT